LYYIHNKEVDTKKKYGYITYRSNKKKKNIKTPIPFSKQKKNPFFGSGQPKKKTGGGPRGGGGRTRRAPPLKLEIRDLKWNVDICDLDHRNTKIP
jgi:hypothetical protein